MQREHRYLVIKLSDIEDSLNMREITGLNMLIDKVTSLRAAKGKQPLECVVIESDWGCYEAAWKLIEEEEDANRHARNYQ